MGTRDGMSLPVRDVHTFRPFSDVPWVRRVEVRHWCMEARSYLGDFRESMLRGDLNADGALAELTAIIDRMNACHRLLSADGRTDAPNFRRDPDSGGE
jgi:hypothetical protein